MTLFNSNASTNLNILLTSGTYTFLGDFVLYSNAAFIDLELTCNTNNPTFVFKGGVSVAQSGSGTVTWNAGTGTITLDNTAAQAVNFNGQTVEPVIVSDASTGAITLGANFTTPYVHDCNSLINLNGFTITETGTDPNPCSSNTYFFPAHFGGRL